MRYLASLLSVRPATPSLLFASKLRNSPALILIQVLFVMGLVTALPCQAAERVVDDLGRVIELDHSVRRVVSLAPSATEILFAVGAGDKIVGDTTYCDYPDAAKRIMHVGGMDNPNLERILSLKPDLVIIASQVMSAGDADQLSAKIRAPVFVTAAASYEGVITNVVQLGAICGRPKMTAQTVHEMRSALEQTRHISAKGPTRTVFVVVWDNPLVTVSGNSFVGDLIRIAGGRNIAEAIRTPYPDYSPEALVAANPDYILIDGAGEKVYPGSLNTPWAHNLEAVRTHRLIAVPSDWTDRPGPRLRFGLLAIASILHASTGGTVPYHT